MRISLAVAVACLTFGGLAAAGDATAAIRKSTDIPAQGLGPALTKLAKEFDFQVLYRTEIVNNLKSQPAVGALTSDEALGKVLTGTGLTYKYLDDKTVTIVPASTAGSTPQNAAGSSDASTSKEAGKKSSQDFRVAQVDQGKSSSASAAGEQPLTSSNTPSVGLQEIVVTAEKREERLQDVPVPVSVLSPDSLVQTGQTSFADYSNQVPGLSGFTSPSTFAQAVSIRGITTGIGATPTVGYTIDDVPIGGATVEQGAFMVPEVNPADLSRIEVLRGPQGTLYGASSMGGLIRFVTLDPSTDGLSGSVQAGTAAVHNGSEPGYDMYGAVNIPVGSALAVRASGFSRQDPGYIDNVLSGQKGVNETRVEGARLAALWNISSSFALKLNAILQETKTNGASEIDVPTAGSPQTAGLGGDLQQARVAGSGASITKLQFYDAVLTGTLGPVTLTSVTGYSRFESKALLDFSFAFGPLAQSLDGVNGATIPDGFSTDTFTQEFRLSGALGQHFDWLLGGFYQHQYADFAECINANDPRTGAQVGPSIFCGGNPFVEQERAGFADLTWKINNQFDVQFGGRLSHIFVFQGPVYLCGLFAGLPPGVCSPKLIYNNVNTVANPFTYLVAPRYRLSPDLMLYARAASGYRAGGGVDNPPPNDPCFIQHFPCAYQPDKTKDYEVGIKGDFLERKLTVDTSVFYIDWKGLQLIQTAPSGLTYTGNGNSAKSEGIEFSVQARPFEGLTLSGWVDWTNAVLTHDLSNTPGLPYGLSGDRLPYSARISGNVSAQEEFPITGAVNGFVGAKVIYVGDRVGEISNTPVRTELPSYAEANLSMGVHDRDWTVTLYCNNVADRRGLTYGGLGYNLPYSFGIIQPRTIGVTVRKTF